MPLRQLLYDALRYESQRREFVKKHRQEADLNREQFISGFSPQDRLIPIMNIVVDWGAEPWDGPLSLHEILDIGPELEEYKDRINDYRINLLDGGAQQPRPAGSP